MNKQAEQLEKNELVDWLDQKFGHLRPYTSQILFGLAALIAIIFSAAFLVKSRADLKATQWQNLNSAINTFSLDRQTSHLLNLAEEYPEAESSMWALQLAGDVELRSGLGTLNSDTNAAVRNLEKAKKAYRRLLESPVKKSPDLVQRATYSLAYCLESLGEFDEAKKVYQQILAEAATSVYAGPSQAALDRLAQPEIIAFYDAYKKTAVAPLGELPKRPDISFPEPVSPSESSDSPPAAEPTGLNPGGGLAPTPPESTQPGTSSAGGDAPTADAPVPDRGGAGNDGSGNGGSGNGGSGNDGSGNGGSENSSDPNKGGR